MGVLLPLTLQGKYVKSLAGKQVKAEIDAGKLIAVLLADGTDRESLITSFKSETMEAPAFPSLDDVAELIENAAAVMFLRQDIKAGRVSPPVEPTAVIESTPATPDEETHNE